MTSLDCSKDKCVGCRNNPKWKNGLCKSCFEQEKYFAELDANLEAIQ